MTIQTPSSDLLRIFQTKKFIPVVVSIDIDAVRKSKNSESLSQTAIGFAIKEGFKAFGISECFTAGAADLDAEKIFVNIIGMRTLLVSRLPHSFKRFIRTKSNTLPITEKLIFQHRSI